MAMIAGATWFRPWINLSQYGGYDEGQLAYAALIADHNDEALRWLRDAIPMQPRVAGYWFNAAIAYDHLNRHAEATAAYKRAFDLEPSNDEYRAAMQNGSDSRPWASEAPKCRYVPPWPP